MKHLKVLKSKKSSINIDINSEKQKFIVHAVRLMFFFSLYVFYNLLNISHSQFINNEFNMSVYFAFIMVSFNSIFIFLNWSKLHSSKVFNFYLIMVDVLSVFFLIQYAQYSPTQFVFIYLAVIIFSGLLLRSEQSLFTAVFCCLLFNMSLASIEPLSPALIYLMNNFSFILTSFLAYSLANHLSSVNFTIEKQEKEIIEVKNINSLIIDNMSSGVITTDNNDKVISFNASAEALFPALAIGNPIDNYLNLSIAIKNDKGFYEFSEDLDGEKRIIESINSTLNDEEGQKKGQIFLLQDLTRIKKLEYAARQQDKLAAVGQLAAGIAHEIRNPLASISGSVQLLESTSKDPENSKLFKIILREIDRLNNLITEFLEFVRPDKVNEEPIDVNFMVDEIMNMIKFNKQVRQDVVLELRLQSKRFIHADYPKLKQAFLNIILNSYQAMEKSNDPVLTINSFDEEDKVVVQIADKGNGIKPETLSKIFEPFHTTKAKGTGLGLAITHKILQNHNAQVFVESELEKGTKFTIEFPGKGDTKPEEARVSKIA